MNFDVLKGKAAKLMLVALMAQLDAGLECEPLGVRGYFKENNTWTVFDNCSGECFVEGKPTKKKAKKWIYKHHK